MNRKMKKPFSVFEHTNKKAERGLKNKHSI